jgi:hypothetical protein
VSKDVSGDPQETGFVLHFMHYMLKITTALMSNSNTPIISSNFIAPSKKSKLEGDAAVFQVKYSSFTSFLTRVAHFYSQSVAASI